MVGKLRERITLVTQTTVSDGIGGFLPGATASVEVWASVAQIQTNEDFTDKKLSQTEIYKVIVRREANANLYKEVVWNGQTMQVEKVERAKITKLYDILYCTYRADG